MTNYENSREISLLSKNIEKKNLSDLCEFLSYKLRISLVAYSDFASIQISNPVCPMENECKIFIERITFEKKLKRKIQEKKVKQQIF